ncbi:MAG: hypothetical protein WD042_13665 [Phycisphaeraceae bacterium]
MSIDQPIEDLIRQVSELDRSACIAHLRQVRSPRLDFDDAYLATRTVEQLRHLLLAALLRVRKAQGHHA